MKVTVDGKSYYTVYVPFFRIAGQTTDKDDFEVFGLRYPSGVIEELVVFEPQNRNDELRDHLKFLLKEYALEDDSMLSPRAKELKEDVKALFGID